MAWYDDPTAFITTVVIIVVLSIILGYVSYRLIKMLWEMF